VACGSRRIARDLAAYQRSLSATVSRSRDIGIDIEYIQCPFDYEQIASSLFAPEDYTLLCALPRAGTSGVRIWSTKKSHKTASSISMATASPKIRLQV